MHSVWAKNKRLCTVVDPASNINLGIIVCSFDVCRASSPFPSKNYGLAKQVPIFLGIKMGNFCQKVLALDSYTRVFTLYFLEGFKFKFFCKLCIENVTTVYISPFDVNFYNNCLISRGLIGSFLSSTHVQTDKF